MITEEAGEGCSEGFILKPLREQMGDPEEAACRNSNSYPLCSLRLSRLLAFALHHQVSSVSKAKMRCDSGTPTMLTMPLLYPM
jgi:hypothetical protein